MSADESQEEKVSCVISTADIPDSIWKRILDDATTGAPINSYIALRDHSGEVDLADSAAIMDACAEASGGKLRKYLTVDQLTFILHHAFAAHWSAQCCSEAFADLPATMGNLFKVDSHRACPPDELRGVALKVLVLFVPMDTDKAKTTLQRIYDRSKGLHHPLDSYREALEGRVKKLTARIQPLLEDDYAAPELWPSKELAAIESCRGQLASILAPAVSKELQEEETVLNKSAFARLPKSDSDEERSTVAQLLEAANAWWARSRAGAEAAGSGDTGRGNTEF